MWFYTTTNANKNFGFTTQNTQLDLKSLVICIILIAVGGALAIYSRQIGWGEGATQFLTIVTGAVAGLGLGRGSAERDVVRHT